MTDTTGREDLFAYLDANSTLQSSRSQVEVLEHSAAVEDFNNQLELLKRRLLTDPT